MLIRIDIGSLLSLVFAMHGILNAEGVFKGVDKNQALFKKKILIYQAYHGFNLLLETVLKDTGFQMVYTVKNHEAVKDMLANKQFDLLIYDLVDEQSIDLYVQLTTYLNVPYTICTSYKMVNIRERLHTIDNVDLFEKPLDVFELQQQVVDILQKSY